jgi:hypothetical protein
MNCPVCKREVTDLKRASYLPVGAGLRLALHDSCFTALDETFREQEQPVKADTTIRKAFTPTAEDKQEFAMDLLQWAVSRGLVEVKDIKR